MRLVNETEFEKIVSQDIVNMQLAVNKGFFDDFLYDFLGQTSGCVNGGLKGSFVDATHTSVAAGTGFFYDATQVGYNPLYRMIQAAANVPVTHAAADLVYDRIDVVCTGSKLRGNGYGKPIREGGRHWAGIASDCEQELSGFVHSSSRDRNTFGISGETGNSCRVTWIFIRYWSRLLPEFQEVARLLTIGLSLVGRLARRLQQYCVKCRARYCNRTHGPSAV
jgi:hypothetical protein